MCADPEMMRALAGEIRQELDQRKAPRQAGAPQRAWPAAACLAAFCIALLALV